MKILPLEYYKHHDVLFLSQDLLGKVLFTKFNDQLTGGIIIETEAYRAPEDKASHAFDNKRTKRNAVMFREGGVCYVYLCYGIHALFNIVTNQADIPHAILIRAIEPLVGVDEMLIRRRKLKLTQNLTVGPGALTQALGIHTAHNGLPLTGPEIWLEDHGIYYGNKNIGAGPRIGVDYAGEDALHPWRFYVKSNIWLV